MCVEINRQRWHHTHLVTASGWAQSPYRTRYTIYELGYECLVATVIGIYVHSPVHYVTLILFSEPTRSFHFSSRRWFCVNAKTYMKQVRIIRNNNTDHMTRSSKMQPILIDGDDFYCIVKSNESLRFFLR